MKYIQKFQHLKKIKQNIKTRILYSNPNKCCYCGGLPNLHSNNPFTPSKNYLDHDPEDVPIYTGHSLFNTTKHITLLFIVHSLLLCNPPNIWIKMI